MYKILNLFRSFTKSKSHIDRTNCKNKIPVVCRTSLSFSGSYILLAITPLSNKMIYGRIKYNAII